MPAAVPLVAAVAGYGASAAIGGGLIGALGGFVVSTAVSQIGGRALSKKPKAAAFSNEAGGRSTVIRSSVESHKIIYGQARVSGPMVYVGTTDNGTAPASGPRTNKMLHMVIALAGHEVEEIGTVFLNDQALELHPNGFAINAPFYPGGASYVYVQKMLGSADQQANAAMMANIPGWNSNHRLRGIAYLYVRLEFNNDVFPLGIPNVSAIVKGKKLFDPRTGLTAWTDNAALCVRDYFASGYGFGCDADEIEDTFFEAAGNVSEEMVTTPNLDVQVVSIDATNNLITLKGSSIPYRVGDRVTVFTDGTQPGGITALTNYFVIPLSGTTNIKLASSYASAVAGTAIDITSAGTGTIVVRRNASPRYTCNGVVDTDVAPLENLNSLMTSLAGITTYVQGKFRLHAGAYDSPVGDITISQLAGDVMLEARTARKELFNAVKGTYLDPAKNWQPTDFPFITNATYEAEDGGERIYKDIELPFTTDPIAAQRIGKIILEKARQGLIVRMPVNHSALKYCAYDVVTLTNEQLGWNAKPFRILKWVMQEDMSIELTLQEESSASYDWNSGEATVTDPAPDTNLPDPFTVQPPGVPAVQEVLYTTTDGSGVKSKAVVSWEPSPDAFVTEYQVEYKLASASSYIVAGRTLKDITTLEVLDIAPGTYDFRVKAISGLGVSSPYASTTKEFVGITAPPADIINFSLNAINNNAHVSWDRVPDLDVRVGGRIRIRYTPELASPTWASAIDIGPAVGGEATQAVLPLLDGTYLIKAVDSAGNESINAATISSTIANIVKMNQVAISQQDPAFAGNKTSMVVVDGGLRLDGLGLFDDAIGDFDDALGLFDLGGGAGYASSGMYEFDDYVDVGKVTTSRVTAAIQSGVFSESVLFDDATGDFDDRPGLFDGGDSSDVMVRLEVRTTDDDPAGTPTWSAWRQFFVGDYTCRAYQFRLQVESFDDTTNISITGLSVTVDVPDIIESGSLTTSAAGATAIVFNKTFVVTPDIGVAIQNAQTGDFEVITSPTAAGFSLGVKNSAGSFVARSVSWVASGY